MIEGKKKKKSRLLLSFNSFLSLSGTGRWSLVSQVGWGLLVRQRVGGDRLLMLCPFETSSGSLSLTLVNCDGDIVS